MLGLVTTYEKENEKGKGKGEFQNGVSEVGEWGLRGVFAFLQVTAQVLIWTVVGQPSAGNRGQPPTSEKGTGGETKFLVGPWFCHGDR